MSEPRHVGTGMAAPPNTMPEVWCGAKLGALEWYFADATHVLLTLRGSATIEPCRECLRAMRSVIDAKRHRCEASSMRSVIDAELAYGLTAS